MPLDRTLDLPGTDPTTGAPPVRWARLCRRLGRFCQLLHAAHAARVPF